MSYSLKNGKMVKDVPKENEKRTLKFYVLAEMTVHVERAGNGDLKIIDAVLGSSHVKTKPEDKLTDQQLGDIMVNADSLTELTGVMLVEQVNRKRNPKVQIAPRVDPTS